MSDAPATEPHVERPGPAEFRDPVVRNEMRRAAVWIGMIRAVAGVIVLAEPLLIIIGGAIFAVLLDGGTRVLGRYLPIARAWRLMIVILLGFGFLGWVGWFAGTTIAEQAESLREVVTSQFSQLIRSVEEMGLLPRGQQTDVGTQLLGTVGRLTTAVGSAIGALTGIVMMLVIGMFLAAEPKMYDRGVAWMLPLRHRESFYRIADHVGFTLRRLLFGRLIGMVFEGLFTYLLLWAGGVPMAALLGLVTGLLAFIPNIGAIVSGVLMVAVGFSAGTQEGLWAIFVYFFVQNVDGYFVVPYIARRTVDLAPALVLAMQVLMGALFGVLGILFADPLLATLKTILVDLSEHRSKSPGETPATGPPSAPGPAPAAAVAASAGASRPRRRGRSSAP